MIDYVLAVLLTCTVLVAPLPLALYLSALTRETSGTELLHAGLRSVCWWSALQATVAISLGAMGHLSTAELFAVELALLSIGWSLSVHPRLGPHDIRRDPRVLFIGSSIAMAAVFVVLAFRSLQEPIPDYDSLSYHLPVMAQWAQTGSLAMPDWSPALGLTHVARYPFSWEAIATIPLLGMGDDSLVTVPSLLAWLWYGLAVAALAERLGASRERALAAAAVAMCVPAALGNINTMRVDVPFAAAVVSGLALSASRARADKVAWLPVAGLMIGMKASGAAYLAIVLVWGIAWVRFDGERHGVLDAAGAKWVPFIAGTIALVVGGGFWYLRNWMEFGNPFGLLRIAVGSVTLFPGYDTTLPLRDTTLAAVFDPAALRDWQILFQSAAAQLSVPFLLLVVEAASLARSRRGSSGAHTPAVRSALFLTAAMLGAYGLTPFSGDNGANGLRVTSWIAQGMRFALPFVAVLGALAAVGMERLHSTRTHLTAIVVCAALWAIVNLLPPKAAAVAAAIVVGSIVLEYARPGIGEASRRRWSRAARRGALVAGAGALVMFTYWCRVVRNENRVGLYGSVVTYVDREARQTDTIGYLLTHQSYVLHGSDLHHRVIAAPLAPTPSEWTDVLKDTHVTLVAVGPLLPDWTSSKELGWLKDRTRFEPVFGSDWQREVLLFRVR